LALIVVLVAVILVNAVYVAAEFAAVSVRRSRIQQLATDGNPLAQWLLPVLESPVELDRYIAACQIGITLSSLVLGAYAQSTIAVWFAPLRSDPVAFTGSRVARRTRSLYRRLPDRHHPLQPGARRLCPKHHRRLVRAA